MHTNNRAWDVSDTTGTTDIPLACPSCRVLLEAQRATPPGRESQLDGPAAGRSDAAPTPERRAGARCHNWRRHQRRRHCHNWRRLCSKRRNRRRRRRRSPAAGAGAIASAAAPAAATGATGGATAVVTAAAGGG